MQSRRVAAAASSSSMTDLHRSLATRKGPILIACALSMSRASPMCLTTSTCDAGLGVLVRGGAGGGGRIGGRGGWTHLNEFEIFRPDQGLVLFGGAGRSGPRGWGPHGGRNWRGEGNWPVRSLSTSPEAPSPVRGWLRRCRNYGADRLTREGITHDRPSGRARCPLRQRFSHFLVLRSSWRADLA